MVLLSFHINLHIFKGINIVSVIHAENIFPPGVLGLFMVVFVLQVLDLQ